MHVRACVHARACAKENGNARVPPFAFVRSCVRACVRSQCRKSEWQPAGQTACSHTCSRAQNTDWTPSALQRTHTVHELRFVCLDNTCNPLLSSPPHRLARHGMLARRPRVPRNLVRFRLRRTRAGSSRALHGFHRWIRNQRHAVELARRGSGSLLCAGRGLQQEHAGLCVPCHARTWRRHLPPAAVLHLPLSRAAAWVEAKR